MEMLSEDQKRRYKVVVKDLATLEKRGEDAMSKNDFDTLETIEREEEDLKKQKNAMDKEIALLTKICHDPKVGAKQLPSIIFSNYCAESTEQNGFTQTKTCNAPVSSTQAQWFERDRFAFVFRGVNKDNYDRINNC